MQNSSLVIVRSLVLAFIAPTSRAARLPAGVVAVRASSAPVGVARPEGAPASARDSVDDILARPFTFHGAVVDERGHPVGGDSVHFSLLDQRDPSRPGTNGTTSSGSDGRFVIAGHGIGIEVEISKPGFYRVPPFDGRLGSAGVFQDRRVRGSAGRGIPSRDQPAVFTLRRIGPTEPLVHPGRQVIAIPLDGAPIDIDLTTGKVVPPGNGQLRVEVWAPTRTAGRYDWMGRLAVPGGGIIDRVGAFDFAAPVTGYVPLLDVVEAATDPQWAPSVERQYFVRLPNNTYARIDIHVITYGDRFVVLDSFLNPVPGHRNLESGAAPSGALPLHVG